MEGQLCGSLRLAAAREHPALVPYLPCVLGSYMRISISKTSSLMFSEAGSGLDVLFEYHICVDYLFKDAPNPSMVTSVLAETTGRHHHKASIA